MQSMSGFMELFEPVLGNDTSEVIRLVQRGVNINSRDSYLRTVLHYAAYFGMAEMMELLVALGAEVNARDRHHMTPLHALMSLGATENCTKALMKSDIPLHVFESTDQERRENKEGIVKDRIEKLKIQLLGCLLKCGADVNAKFDVNVTSMHKAIRRRNVTGVNVLATLGVLADKNNFDSKAAPIFGMTPLFQAVKQEQIEIMKYLVHSGADVNALCSQVPVLQAAVQSGNVLILETVLKHWPRRRLVSFDSLSSISLVSFAVWFKLTDLGIFTCLSNLGADFDIPCTVRDPIHEALLLSTTDVLNCLIRYGADVATFVCPVMVKPPVLQAFNDGEDLDLLAQLVRCGADINAKFDAVDLMTFAARRGNTGMVKALLRHTIPEKTSIYTGLTIISFLAVNCMNSPTLDISERILYQLLDLGADINAQFDRLRVDDDAVLRGDVETVKLLGDHGHLFPNKKMLLRGITILAYSLVSPQVLINEVQGKELIMMLVVAGADVNAKYDTVTPISLAVERQDKAMVETLVSFGANVNCSLVKGRQPMHSVFSLFNPTDILDEFLKRGADPNAQQESEVDVLLETLRRGDTEMAQCLLRCGADPNFGWGCHPSMVIHVAMLNHHDHTSAIKALIRAGADLNAMLVLGDIFPLEENIKRVAKTLGIDLPKAPTREITLLTQLIISSNTNYDILGLFLAHGANMPLRQNREWKTVTVSSTIEKDPSSASRVVECRSSNLHEACLFGDLNIVRLLIIDGSNVNELDSNGQIPFRRLPLFSSVDLGALFLTGTFEKVTERVGLDYTPITSVQGVEHLISTPGLGDVKSIRYPSSTEISKHVQQLMEKFCKNSGICSKVLNCGSSAEGTKAGLPDEMDFLGEIIQLDDTAQRQMEYAGHDYVRYADPMYEPLEAGSKRFHKIIMNRVESAMYANYPRMVVFEDCKISFHFADSGLKISNANRRANTPLLIRWKGPNMAVPVRISVDFVPSLQVPNNWPEGGVSKTWLLSLGELRRRGYYLVPKPPHSSTKLAGDYPPNVLETLWKISFPHLETYHMQHLEKRVKDVYVLAKCLRNPDVCRIMVTDQGSYPKNVDKFVTSYMLKMIFFENVEDFLSSDLSLGEMVCRVYDEVAEGLSKGFIPLYFMPKVSALAGHKLDIPKCARVAKIMQKYVHALYLRDCSRDQDAGDDEEVIVYQRNETSVYKCIEIAQPDEMPEIKDWDCY